MIEPAADIARRLRRDAKSRVASRHWAGWKLQLTFGAYLDAFDPETIAFARTTTEQITGQKFTPELDAAARAVQRDEWHLSVSWRGDYPVEEGSARLAELLAAIGVPVDKREGRQPARVFSPDGRQSPQVTHWIWRDPEA